MKKQDIIEGVNRLYISTYTDYIEALKDSYQYRTDREERLCMPSEKYDGARRALHLVLYTMELDFKLILNSDIYMYEHRVVRLEKQLGRHVLPDAA